MRKQKRFFEFAQQEINDAPANEKHKHGLTQDVAGHERALVSSEA